MKKKKIKIWIIVAVSCSALYLLLAGKDGLINLYYRIYRPLKKQKAEIRQLYNDIDSLKNEKRELESDTAYIEKIAREKLGMAKDGETIYKFTE